MGRLKEAVLNGLRIEPQEPIDPIKERAMAKTVAELTALARRRGYKNPEWWAKKVIEGRRNK